MPRRKVYRDPVPFAENVRRLRQERGMTQEQLAVKIGLTRIGMVMMETGRTWPSADSLLSLAEVLGVSTDEILGHREAAPEAKLEALASANRWLLAENQDLRQRLGVIAGVVASFPLVSGPVVAGV